MYIKPAYGAHSFPLASNSSMGRHGSGLYLKFGYFVHHGFFFFFCIRFDFLKTIALKYYLPWWLTFSAPTSMCTPSQCLPFLIQLPALPKSHPHLACPPRVWSAARGHIHLATFHNLTTRVSIPHFILLPLLSFLNCFTHYCVDISSLKVLYGCKLFCMILQWWTCHGAFVRIHRMYNIESESWCQLRTWGDGDVSV